jgi:hypothetical protein
MSLSRSSKHIQFVPVVLLSGILASALALFASDGSNTLQVPDFKPDAQARALVRTIVGNELKQQQNDRSHWMFKLRKVTPKGSRLQEVITTSQGNLARTLLINDQPLTAEQKRSEEEKIQKILTDPDLQRKRLKDEKEDNDRALLMVRALPNAFFYREIGREGDVVKFQFRPDPDYKPQSHEESVYTGMSGQLWLNVAQSRLQMIDAHLFHDVDFGWGILGRLYKGGSFMVQQEPVNGSHWDTTKMTLDLTGKALLFKSLAFQEQEYATDFRRVPDNVTLMQGVDMLNKGIPQVADKTGE